MKIGYIRVSTVEQNIDRQKESLKNMDKVFIDYASGKDIKREKFAELTEYIREDDDHKYTYSHIGYNLKITDWQAAIALAQLEKLPSFLEKRTDNAELLNELLNDLQEYLILPKVSSGVEPSWFGYLLSVKLNEKFDKQGLVTYLEKNGVGTRQLFAGNMLRQPMLCENDIDVRIGNSGITSTKNLTESEYALLPNTDFIMNNSFWVGVFPALGEEEMQNISATIHHYITDKSKG